MNIAKQDKRIALFCLTPGGVKLARKLRKRIPLQCYTSTTLQELGFDSFGTRFVDCVQAAYHRFDALIIIGATGIAVRVLAPVIKDKLSDPAVVVLDEKVQFVISLLSGHVGGANALARKIASITEGQAVVTTATDVNKVAALDTLASQMNATMKQFRQTVKKVNQWLVSDKPVGIWWHPDLRHEQAAYDLSGFTLVESLDALPPLTALIVVSYRNDRYSLSVPVFQLIPRRVVAGIGCRKNSEEMLVAELFTHHLKANAIHPLAVYAIGSITLKAKEPALIALARDYQAHF